MQVRPVRFLIPYAVRLYNKQTPGAVLIHSFAIDKPSWPYLFVNIGTMLAQKLPVISVDKTNLILSPTTCLSFESFAGKIIAHFFLVIHPKEPAYVLKSIAATSKGYTLVFHRIVSCNDVTRSSTSKIEDLAVELKKDYTIIMVTHNMQQAARISDNTAFFLLGEMVEFGKTEMLFSMPKDKRTEDYITGRFG